MSYLRLSNRLQSASCCRISFAEANKRRRPLLRAESEDVDNEEAEAVEEASDDEGQVCSLRHIISNTSETQLGQSSAETGRF